MNTLRHQQEDTLAYLKLLSNSIKTFLGKHATRCNSLCIFM